MNPLRLTLEGFRSFGRLELDLPAGCVTVHGRNGAGKSTLIDAVDVALFGPEGRSFGPYLQAGASRMLLELDLEHGGRSYRVRRTYNGRAATLDLERFDYAEHSGAWTPLTQATVADTQAALERLLGITRTTLRASAILRQGHGGAFTEAPPAQRKQVLADALGLDSWAAAAELVRGDLRAHHQERATLAGRAAAIAEALERAGDPDAARADAEHALAAAAAAITSAEERAGALREQHAAAVEADVLASRTAAELAGARLTAARVDEVRTRSQDAAARLAEHEQRVGELEREVEAAAEALNATQARLAAAEAEAAAWDEARATRDRLAREGDELRPTLAELERRRKAIVEAEVPHCYACEQPLGTAAREAALATIDREDQALTGRLDQLRAEHDAVVLPPAPDRAELDRLRDELRRDVAAHAEAPVRLEVVRQTIAKLREQVHDDPDELDRQAAAAAAEVVALERRLADLPEPNPLAAATLAAQLTELDAQLTGSRRLHTDAAREVARLEALAETVRGQRADLNDTNAHLARLDELAGDLESLLAAFGRDGIPAWIVEHHALPAIEAEANRILTVLAGPVERVELRTERELKAGGTTDALDISCVTASGERDYSTFSGGERTRVNLALRIALARLLARRRDADVRLLAIDEPDGLDEQGMGALIDVLRGLVTRGEFDTVMLASHVPALRDAFDRAIVVERGTAGSQVAVS